MRLFIKIIIVLYVVFSIILLLISGLFHFMKWQNSKELFEASFQMIAFFGVIVLIIYGIYKFIKMIKH